MKIEITAKNYEVSQKLRDIIERKVEKLNKYFDDDATVKVLCKQENNILKLELNIRSKGLFYRSEVAGDNMYENIDLALPKIERQIVKYSDKVKSKLKKGTKFTEDFVYIEKAPEPKEKKSVVKKKTYELEPIGVEDALMFLDNLDNTFYVFLNRETNKVNVIYRRLDGNFGLIETIY